MTTTDFDQADKKKIALRIFHRALLLYYTVIGIWFGYLVKQKEQECLTIAPNTAVSSAQVGIARVSAEVY